ncbi:MAG: cation transporter [Bacteroidales bacterium]|nr:cation transporter [Bacteroidales bacterium]
MGVREREIYKVTLVGSVGNAALLAFKFVAGIVGHSSAMIADAVHSLSDFLTDIVVLIFVGISSKPQDETHDYGHGKFETVASFLIGLALLGAAVGIVVSGALKFARWLSGETLEMPGKLALWAALVSIVVKEALYRYTAAKGKRLDSQAVVANAWHHRSDALSSVAAALGIGGAIVFGGRWTVLDPLASIVVGIMLAIVSLKLLKVSIGELTDKSLPSADENDIMKIISSVSGVSEPHHLKTRRLGNRISIEAHVRMDGGITLEDAHGRATDIEHKLKERFGKDTHVTLHMEPKKTAKA